jgi:predicted nucleotide-binding protein (sugar kinase/HSP70/actin superfamily)
MGISSRIAAACLRHFNIDTMVLPTHTREGYELARKHIHTEVCHPLKGVAGDVLDFLHAEKSRLGQEAVERKYVFILPTTDGPCRFGKYRETVRFFLDEEGFAKVPIAGPSTKSDYLDILDGGHTTQDEIDLQKLMLRGIIASDLLDDITLRFRPYHDKDEIGRLKETRLVELEKRLEKGDSVKALAAWGQETARQFGRFGTDRRFPLVLYSGEIYMRMHDPYTSNVIERLEENHLEVIRCPVIEWLEYINCTNLLETKRDMALAMKNFDLKGFWRGVKIWGKLAMKNAYIGHVKHKMSRPFEAVLRGRHQLPPMSKLLKTIEQAGQFHTSISGESILGIGIAYYLLNGLLPQTEMGISGIFHVGPFTCMHEGVVTAKMEGMIRQKRKTQPQLVFPVIDAYFGDSPNPNLDAEIAIFREQCYQKRDLIKNPSATALAC